MKRLAWVLAAALAGCQAPQAVTPLDHGLQGRVLWPASRQLQAVLTDITSQASVTLIDASTNAAKLSGVTDASGNFSLIDDSANPTFNPSVGQVFLLDASKGLARSGTSGYNTAGALAPRLRTIVKWGPGWSSVAQAGSTHYINADTTAVAIPLSLRGYGPATNVNPNAFANEIGAITVGGGGTTFSFTAPVPAELPAIEQAHVKALVTGAIAADEDPLGQIRIINGYYLLKDKNGPIIEPSISNLAATTPALLTASDCTFSVNAATPYTELFIANTGSHDILKYTTSPAAMTVVAGTAGTTGTSDGTGAAAKFNAPKSLVGDARGNLYVADTGNHVIRKIVVSTGVVTTVAGTAGSASTTDGTGAAARFNAPSGITYDGQDALYISDAGSGRLRKLVISTLAVSTIATGLGANATTGVSSLTHDGGLPGNLYVCDTSNNLVKKVDLSTNAVSTLAGGGSVTTDAVGSGATFNAPRGILSDGSRFLYVGDGGNNYIKTIDLASTAYYTIRWLGAGANGTTAGVGQVAKVTTPWGMAYDSLNDVMYNVDSGATFVRKLP